MSSENRALVTLGADVGGKDAHLTTHDFILYLRRLLQQKCKGPYSTVIKEFAFVLRIDGSVHAWGKSGAENAALLRKNAFATVDIFVPITEWADRDAAHIRKILAEGLMDAIEAIAKFAEGKQVNIDIHALRRDVGAATREFLT